MQTYKELYQLRDSDWNIDWDIVKKQPTISKKVDEFTKKYISGKVPWEKEDIQESLIEYIKISGLPKEQKIIRINEVNEVFKRFKVLYTVKEGE
jgi:hypothetical protein